MPEYVLTLQVRVEADSEIAAKDKVWDAVDYELQEAGATWTMVGVNQLMPKVPASESN